MQLRLADYVSVTWTTSDNQSNGRRTAVESKSNHSCDHRVSTAHGIEQKKWKESKTERQEPREIRVVSRRTVDAVVGGVEVGGEVLWTRLDTTT